MCGRCAHCRAVPDLLSDGGPAARCDRRRAGAGRHPAGLGRLRPRHGDARVVRTAPERRSGLRARPHRRRGGGVGPCVPCAGLHGGQRDHVRGRPIRAGHLGGATVARPRAQPRGAGGPRPTAHGVPPDADVRAGDGPAAAAAGPDLHLPGHDDEHRPRIPDHRVAFLCGQVRHQRARNVVRGAARSARDIRSSVLGLRPRVRRAPRSRPAGHDPRYGRRADPERDRRPRRRARRRAVSDRPRSGRRRAVTLAGRAAADARSKS